MLHTLLEAAKALIHIVTPLNLAFISFIEAIFFPIPPDAILIPLVLLNPHNAILFALITAVTSVLGASVGYFIGRRGGRPILDRFASSERIQQIEELFAKYDVWSTAIAAFTPIPYKVFALAAGVFSIPLGRFLVVSFFCRMLRFSIIAVLLMIYGAHIAEFLQRNYEWLTIGVTGIVIIAVLLYRFVLTRNIKEAK